MLLPSHSLFFGGLQDLCLNSFRSDIGGVRTFTDVANSVFKFASRNGVEVEVSCNCINLSEADQPCLFLCTCWEE